MQPWGYTGNKICFQSQILTRNRSENTDCFKPIGQVGARFKACDTQVCGMVLQAQTLEFFAWLKQTTDQSFILNAAKNSHNSIKF